MSDNYEQKEEKKPQKQRQKSSNKSCGCFNSPIQMAMTLVENLTYWVDKDTSGKFEVERVTMTGNKHGADTICSFFYLMVRCSDSQMFTFWALWRSEDYLPIFTLWLDLIPQGLDVVSNLWDVNLIEQLMTMMVE